MSFDTLKTAWKLYSYNDKEGVRLSKQSAEYSDSSRTYDLKNDEKLSKAFKTKADSVNEIIYKNEESYKKTIDYYLLRHTYRAKNQLGALGLHKTEFTVDSAVTKIEGAEEKEMN